MSFPLLLTKEELAILRVMLKTTITNRICEVAASYRATVLATPSAETGDAAREDAIFVGRINTWVNQRTLLDLPLLEASLRIRDATVVIVNLNKDAFEALQKIANQKFTTSDTDPDSIKLIERIQVVQPALKGAFEVADAHEKAVANPTQKLADGKN